MSFCEFSEHVVVIENQNVSSAFSDHAAVFKQGQFQNIVRGENHEPWNLLSLQINNWSSALVGLQQREL